MSNSVFSRLVWDGTEEVRIPKELGTPRQDQMQGTTAERLSELSGRTCYDSLGKGRSSADYHPHILGVGHGSVLEHYTRTVEIEMVPTVGPWALVLLPVFMNRPGFWVERREGETTRVTMNLRGVSEWDRWTSETLPELDLRLSHAVGNKLKCMWSGIAPMIVERPDIPVDHQSLGFTKFVEPETDHEKWLSLFLVSSRGVSHEQVRHGNESGVSQRSTRFVDESQGRWSNHPLVEAYLREATDLEADDMQGRIQRTVSLSQETYRFVVEKLEPWLANRMPAGPYTKSTARKQARGAARGYLGNALETELVFSASVSQWRHMLRMRAADSADAEIRILYGSVLSSLRESRYRERFDDILLEPSSDRLGFALLGGGAQ